MKKKLILLLFLMPTLVFSQKVETVPVVAAVAPVVAEAPQKAISIQNEFLKISVNGGPYDKGRFGIDTTWGDPQNRNDDNKSLIYGNPIPWTSYTSIMIDGEVYVFGGVNKKISKRAGKSVSFGEVVSQVSSPEGINTECRFGNVRVIQRLKFFKNPSTKVNDSVLITYEVINSDSAPHKVGVRIMMDTKLGDNDGAPFRIGEQAIQSERMFSGKAIQDYWQAFDSITSPNVIAQGFLNLPEDRVLPPDRFYLVNWGTLADAPWDFDYQEGRSFVRAGELDKDTALALYWDGTTIAPQKSWECSTVYGLGGVSRSFGSLSLGLTAPAEVFASSKKDILVMAYVSNTGIFDSRDTKVSFVIPSGFVVVDGDVTTDLGTFITGRTRQIPIKLRVVRTSSGLKKLTLNVTSSTLEKNSLSRVIEIQPAPSVKVSLSVPERKVITLNNFLDVKVKVTNTSRVSLERVGVELAVDAALEMPLFERSYKVINKIAPKETVELTWTLKVLDPDKKSASISATVSSPVLETETFRDSFQLALASQRFYLEPSAPIVQKGDYFYVLISGDYVGAFDDLSMTLSFEPDKVAYQRLSPEDWVVQSLQARKLSMEPNKLTISGLKNSEGALKKRIAKLHFLAKQAGVQEFRLVDGNQSSKIRVTVVE